MRYVLASLVSFDAWFFYGPDFRFWSVLVALIVSLIVMRITGWSADE